MVATFAGVTAPEGQGLLGPRAGAHRTIMNGDISLSQVLHS
jgi:hypothetical protein